MRGADHPNKRPSALDMAYIWHGRIDRFVVLLWYKLRVRQTTDNRPKQVYHEVGAKDLERTIVLVIQIIT